MSGVVYFDENDEIIYNCLVDGQAETGAHLDDIYNIAFLAPCDLEDGDIVRTTWGGGPLAVIRDGRVIWGESEETDLRVISVVERRMQPHEIQAVKQAANMYGLA